MTTKKRIVFNSQINHCNEVAKQEITTNSVTTAFMH